MPNTTNMDGNSAIQGDGDDSPESVVPVSEREQPEGTVEVVYPAFMVDASGEDAAAYAEDLVSSSPRLCEAAYANEDGTVSLYATDAQLAGDLSLYGFYIPGFAARAQVDQTHGQDFSISVDIADGSTG